MIALVQGELRRFARRTLAVDRWIGTLSTTVLVNASCLRLVSSGARRVQTRAHFLTCAAHALRPYCNCFRSCESLALFSSAWILGLPSRLV